MKNNILFFFLSLILFSCGENKKETTKSEEVQKIMDAKPDVDVEAAKIAIDSTGLYYQMDLDGNPDLSSLRRDTTWHLYKPVVDTLPDENKPPIVNAGNDQTITLPTSTVTLAGFANDPEGEAITYKWVKLSGGNATITNSTSATTTVTGLTAGSYQFRLGAIDEDGGTGTDDVNVVVNSMPVTVGAIEGYGALTTGGAGYQTIRITNLSQLQSNIGSNRTLLIDVSGTIGSFNINNVSNLTIDAYSTKQDVTVSGGNSDGLNINNSTNIIVRGLRFKGFSNDGLNVTGTSSNVVIDHCSSYDNDDGNIDLVATSNAGKNFTVQYSIMGKNNGTGNMLITTQNASVHHNLFIGDGGNEGAERNPFAHSNYSPKGTQTNPNFDVRNNLIHASGRYASGCGYGAVGNFVNNYFTSNKSGLINLCADANSCSKAHVSGNFNQPSPAGGSSSPEYTIPSQYRINMTDAVTAGRAVLASVGPYKRDSYELGVINSINIGGNPNPTACTGYTYSAWSTCTNGIQTRTVTGTTPAGCTGQPSASPVLSQACTPDPGGGGYPGYSLVYSTGYDDVNSIDPFGHGQWGSGTQASHLSTTIFKTGPGSFKSGPLANVSSGTRSEVQYESPQSPLEGILEYDAYYDNFFANSGHSLQWHPSTGGGSGTGLYHKGGKMQFVTVKSGTSGTNVGSPFTITTKVWHHFKLTYKFGNSGYIRVELDGVEKVNANVQMGDGSSPYLKVGVNAWTNATSIVYYDNLKVYKKS